MKIDDELGAADLLTKVDRLWEASAAKIDSIERTCPPGTASPVFTVRGRYTARGWTEWTQGFQYGSALLQFDATGDKACLDLGAGRTARVMASHVSHIGVHDHGFNNVSTYGNLWRLGREGRAEVNVDACELALKVSGAVRAARWRSTEDGTGYMYSFNGPQSLFVDTIRSCRSLAVAHRLGHVLMGEHDERISLLARLVEHATNTARYNVFYGEGRDRYDVRGRTAHEALFNPNDGRYRCAVLGHGCPRAGPLGTLPRPAGGPVQRSRAGRRVGRRDPGHQGLLLHSVYHRPNGWDHVAPGQSVPNGESSMWGDYHLREVALYVRRLVTGDPYHTFFGGAA